MIIPPLVFALILAISLNLFVFIFAFKRQTDHYTDITYSATFILLAAYFYYIGETDVLPRTLMFLMVLVWAVRLGTYLKLRIGKTKVDHRFDEMRPNFMRYLRFWIIQGTSVWVIAIPAVILLSKDASIFSTELPFLSALAVGLWVSGFLLQTIADYQKYTFRNDSKNDGMFMAKGFFNIIRFPAYLGEMLVWIGVFLFTVPYISGLEWLGIVSPLWIIGLLLFLSGIPMLEKQSEKRYGHLPAYQKYKKETSRLIPGVY